MRVRILPDNLINLIRAGEVVERPAQVVKELCENAIDSGASDLRILIRGAGREIILVEDNGCGMEADDLALAVRRHATSKLPDGKLDAIGTLGFRGEALAAIGAACRLSIATRSAEDTNGWRITVDNGKESDVVPCGLRPGTRVEVTKLFASHPARLKALASPRAEAAAIRETVRCLALARPDVSFTLDDGGAGQIRFQAAGLDVRAMAVMGRRFAEICIPFSACGDGTRVSGWVVPPASHTGGTADVRVVVNGRPVRDRTVAAALKSAWKDLSGTDGPPACIFLDLPCGDVDHNAHSTKAEIRLSTPKAVHDLVRTALSEALGAASPVTMAAISMTARGQAMPVTHSAADWRHRPLGRPLGFIGDRYVVCQTMDGVILVDAHAAHERVVHERLKAAIADGGVDSRKLPSPVIVEVGERAAAAIADREADLLFMGLGIAAMDGGAVSVTSVPDCLGNVDAVAVVRSVAAVLADNPWADPLRDSIGELCALLSCHAAIRSGDSPGNERLEALLREIEETPNGGVCNHGRPTSLKFSMEQLDRMFGRT